jgi:hypothetical protein
MPPICATAALRPPQVQRHSIWAAAPVRSTDDWLPRYEQVLGTRASLGKDRN